MIKTGVSNPKPFGNSEIAVFLRRRIDELAGIKNQREIANEMGYDKGNILSMFKAGETRVPLDKIPALARALNVDVVLLFRLAYQQYWPDAAKALNEIFGSVMTKNNRAWAEVIVSALGEPDPEPTPELRKVVADALLAYKKQKKEYGAGLKANR